MWPCRSSFRWIWAIHHGLTLACNGILEMHIDGRLTTGSSGVDGSLMSFWPHVSLARMTVPATTNEHNGGDSSRNVREDNEGVGYEFHSWPTMADALGFLVAVVELGGEGYHGCMRCKWSWWTGMVSAALGKMNLRIPWGLDVPGPICQCKGRTEWERNTWRFGWIKF